MPSGRSLSDSPTRARRIVSATVSTACSWPITRRCRSPSSSCRRSQLAGHQLADRDPGAGGDHGRDLGLADHGRAASSSAPIGDSSASISALSAPASLVGLGVDGGLLLRPGAPRARPQRRERAGRAAHARGGLVDQVDRLVGQVVLGDVAVATAGPRRRAPSSAIRHAVVRLVGAPQAAQDRDRLLDGRLLDGDGREPARQRAVALDRAVLGQRGGADHAQLAAREQRLEDVGGVHRALGLRRRRASVCSSSTNSTIWPSDCDDLGERGLQALLELAAVLRAGEHAGEVERHDAGVAQRLGHVAVRRCAARGPRRSRSCRRRPRRSARRCSCAGGRGSRPSARSRRRGRSRGRCGRPPRRRSGRARTRRARVSRSAARRWAARRRRPAAAHCSHSEHARDGTVSPSANTSRTRPGRSPQLAQTGTPACGSVFGKSMHSLLENLSQGD